MTDRAMLGVLAPAALAVVLASVNSLVVACAATPSRTDPVESRAVLLPDEIQASNVRTVYDAIVRLRPQWLRRRGRISFQDPDAGEVVVYVNDVRYGGARSLESLPADAVQLIQHLDASDATTRFGTGHGGGAILIQTR